MTSRRPTSRRGRTALRVAADHQDVVAQTGHLRHVVDSPTDYAASLPRKRMAAGGLLLDAAGRILLVKPTYRPHWLVPGGVVEAQESPRQACVREIREETALEVSPIRLLCVDYQQGDGVATEAMHFIFYCGELDPAQISRIRLPPTELSEHRFVPFDEAGSLLIPRLALRVASALQALADGTTIYSENGER